MSFSMELDLFPLLAAVLAASVCAILGNFLVLRRLSLMGDTISHSVLPGLVIAFLVSTSRNPAVMFVGAAAAGAATVVLVELVKRLGRVEAGAAMGVVFSVAFALGVLLIEQAARETDLDADCVLYGQLEYLAFSGGPRVVAVLGGMLLLTVGFVAVFFKELRIAAFDPALATAQGINATVMHYVLMVFVAAATVASFEAVGSILVIAMLVAPGAAARMLTDRMLSQLLVSVGLAVVAAVGGYLAASAVPGIWEKDSVSAAGSIAVMAGVLLGAAIAFGPRHGLVTRWLRRRRLGATVARDDLLLALYRAEESGAESVRIDAVRAGIPGGEGAMKCAVRDGYVGKVGGGFSLTERGRALAMDLIRRHRLWELYLVEEAGVAPDHVHETAEVLEHLRPIPPGGATRDPHGREIPAPDQGTGSVDRGGNRV